MVLYILIIVRDDIDPIESGRVPVMELPVRDKLTILPVSSQVTPCHPQIFVVVLPSEEQFHSSGLVSCRDVVLIESMRSHNGLTELELRQSRAYITPKKDAPIVFIVNFLALSLRRYSHEHLALYHFLDQLSSI